jgi:hypothetical protein
VAAGRSTGAVAEARLYDPGGRPRTEQGELLGFGEHRFVPETEPSTRVGYNGLVVTEDPAHNRSSPPRPGVAVIVRTRPRRTCRSVRVATSVRSSFGRGVRCVVDPVEIRSAACAHPDPLMRHVLRHSAVGTVGWRSEALEYGCVFGYLKGRAMDAIGGPYPATFAFDAPELIAKWRPLAHWLLAIPHLAIVYAPASVSEVVAVISWVAVLFTG